MVIVGTAKIIAQYLLQIKAIKLAPSNPFTWASGIKSPVYCDNRKTLSFPEVRTAIRDGYVEIIKLHFPNAELIAGVATGAIAQGALVSDALQLPFVYVRSAPKDHGLENLIEGNCHPGQKVVVIEDLISTGGSSLKAVKALREAGCEVLGMIAIFTYGFNSAVKNFETEKVPLYTLTDYETMTEIALESNYIGSSEIETLRDWRKSPETWGNKK